MFSSVLYRVGCAWNAQLFKKEYNHLNVSCLTHNFNSMVSHDSLYFVHRSCNFILRNIAGCSWWALQVRDWPPVGNAKAFGAKFYCRMVIDCWPFVGGNTNAKNQFGTMLMLPVCGHVNTEWICDRRTVWNGRGTQQWSQKI